MCRWFGLILLPIVSYSADGTITAVFCVEKMYKLIKRQQTMEPTVLAYGRAIDRAIQFTLWWIPFVVLLGWFTHHPMHMLFGA